MKVCNGSRNATHLECWAPALSATVSEDRFDDGTLAIHIDGKDYLYKTKFVYHADAKVIPFEKENNILVLKPGDDEVSLHV